MGSISEIKDFTRKLAMYYIVMMDAGILQMLQQYQERGILVMEWPRLQQIMITMAIKIYTLPIMEKMFYTTTMEMAPSQT